jgi:rare lipoprotein A
MILIRLFVLFLFSSLLVACAEYSARPSAPATPSGQSNAKKPGGYYLDDGPGDHPPADIYAIPDAVPRVEPLLARANKPYIALGNGYTPMTQFTPYKKSGIASWYGRRYHGQQTSTGEVYDMYGMTGAHTILPLPSYVRVTNPANQKSVIVRINDRGPFHSDRLIDLSYAAAYKLGIVGKGSGLVEVEAIDAKNFVANKAEVKAAPAKDMGDVEIKPLVQDRVTASAPVEKTTESTEKIVASESGIFVQVGAFKSSENAGGLSKKILDQNLVEKTPVNSWYNQGVYRVRIGPYSNRADADRAAMKIKDSLGLNTYIIVQP